jgi:hypothetical protein
MEARCRSNFSARTLSQPKVTRRRCTHRPYRPQDVHRPGLDSDRPRGARCCRPGTRPRDTHRDSRRCPEDLCPPVPGGGRARYLEEEGHVHSSSSPALNSASSSVRSSTRRSGWRRGNQYNSPREAESPKFVAGEPDECPTSKAGSTWFRSRGGPPTRAGAGRRRAADRLRPLRPVDWQVHERGRRRHHPPLDRRRLRLLIRF